MYLYAARVFYAPYNSYIYFFLTGLSGVFQVKVFMSRTILQTLLLCAKNIHLYTVHCALTHDTAWYICPVHEKQNLKRRIQRQDPVLGQSRKWRLNSYGVQLLYGTLRIRGACFDCALPHIQHADFRFALADSHAIDSGEPCHFAPDRAQPKHERKAPAAQRGSCSISCAEAWAFTIWPC